VDAALIADLAAEQEVLDNLLAGRPAGDWLRPTPAEGWTIADTIRHLALSEVAAEASVVQGRDIHDTNARPLPLPDVEDGPGLLAWWRDARTSSREALGQCENGMRVPWGGRLMAAPSLATARLMECWAHGLDCFAALGVEPVDTERLRHIAWLGWRSLPQALALAGVAPPAPPASLRLLLDAPTGATWEIGAAELEATGVITGPAGDWCRIATHRLRPPAVSRLQSRGDLAERSVTVARAFL
jgi:uncharacterized protein (TIGR03084 family)